MLKEDELTWLSDRMAQCLLAMISPRKPVHVFLGVELAQVEMGRKTETQRNEKEPFFGVPHSILFHLMAFSIFLVQ